MSPRLRKAALTAHVTCSVGWLGAVAAFLALAVTGVVSDDPQLVRSAYLTMSLIGWLVLVPLSALSLVSGVVQSLGTPWGLLRHYWVVAKLVINVVATVILLVYMQTLSFLGGLASRPTLSRHELNVLQSPSPVLHSVAALMLLLAATTLAVVKPRGLTRRGRRLLAAAR